jgi:creatinine amidohydrolase
MVATRRLEDLRAPQVAALIGPSSVVVLPVGAVEQHGPHLPLSVDTVIVEETARAVVAARGHELDLWLLPTLTVSKSNEHAWAPGSLWLGPDTLLRVLDDLGRCVARTGARRFAFLNAHGGNSALLQVACRELRLAHGLMTFLLHTFLPPDQGGASAAGEMGMGIHGGHDETSLMLHLRPSLVDMAAASRNVPEHLAANRFVRFGGAVPFGWSSDDFGPAGHIGDPTTASAEEGRRLFEAAVALVGEQLGEVSTFSFP